MPTQLDRFQERLHTLNMENTINRYGSHAFKVTWRHRSRDDSIPHMRFSIGVPLEPSLYLQAFSRYSAPKCFSIANLHSSLRMRDITWPVPPIQNLGTYFSFSPHIAIHCGTFIGLRWRIRVFAPETPSPPMLNVKSSWNFFTVLLFSYSAVRPQVWNRLSVSEIF